MGYTEIQLLGQNVNSLPRSSQGKRTFAELLAAVGEVPGIRRVRFTTSHPRDFAATSWKPSMPCRRLCDHVHLPVQSGSSRVLERHGAPVHARTVPERISWMKAARRRDQHHQRHHCRISRGRPKRISSETLDFAHEVQYDGVFAFKYSPRPNTPALSMIDSIPEEEKSRR